MLSNRPRYQPRGVARSNLSRGGPVPPADYIWQSIWPYRISTIIGGLIMLFAVTVFALEIGLLTLFGNVSVGGVYGTGVGIWTGFWIFVASILILILNCVKPVRLWAFIAFIATIIAAIFAIISFSINAARVQLASSLGIFSYSSSSISSVGSLPAAELAFGVVIFLLCLGFIGLYIYIATKISKYGFNKQQIIASPVQGP